MTESQLTALTDAARAAAECEKTLDVPAGLIVAQWAIESGWGKHVSGNNCFGIKHYPGAFGRQLLRTKEWFTPAERDRHLKTEGHTAELADAASLPNRDGRRLYYCRAWFATFPSLEACFRRRAELFRKGRYAAHTAAWREDRDLEKLVRAIAPIYATAPGYADTVLAVVNMREVQAALSAARA